MHYRPPMKIPRCFWRYEPSLRKRV